MARYRRRYRRRRWRGYRGPSKTGALHTLFGDAVTKIRDLFLALDANSLEQLLDQYEEAHGVSAARYARTAFPEWQSRARSLSGQTMERLIELVPPFLSAEQRLNLLQDVVHRHKPYGSSKSIRIDVKNPEQGIHELDAAIEALEVDAQLAHIPEIAMQAATWLYDDDITAARAMWAEVSKRENEVIRNQARKDIELLKRTIRSGQVKAANYTVQMPAGHLRVVAYSPSACFVAQACCGDDSPEVKLLRDWRDACLLRYEIGRRFVVFYYQHGEHVSATIQARPTLKCVVRAGVRVFAFVLRWFWRKPDEEIL